MVHVYPADGHNGFSRSVQTHMINVGINAADTEITEHVTELDEAAMAPELDEPGTTPEPEEPTMIDIDDEHFANMANVKVPVHYDFPSDDALHYYRLVKLHPVTKPTLVVVALERVMFTEMFGANTPCQWQRSMIDQVKTVLQEYELEYEEMRHTDTVFDEHVKHLIQAST
ncbi:hypothetical protein IWW56_002296 [Coemansia sp. RSA 2131]|nr:hypothetical protein IWW56_002296 [Coemansia sp. RSA 2131]